MVAENMRVGQGVDAPGGEKLRQALNMAVIGTAFETRKRTRA